MIRVLALWVLVVLVLGGSALMKRRDARLDVPCAVLQSGLVTEAISKYPQHQFAEFVFEDCDNGCADHAYALTLVHWLTKAPNHIITFDFDADASGHVTRVTLRPPEVPYGRR
jgi:hypothetical protein